MDLSIVKHENDFNTFTPEKIDSIVSGLPEIYRANRAFGRQKTQTSGALLTLSMGGHGPYRVLRQIGAQIDDRVKTLKDTEFKLRRQRIKLRIQLTCVPKSPVECELFDLEVEKLRYQISSVIPYIEGAIKDIAMFQNWYKQVCKAHKIPDNWDERDSESGEIAHYIALAFNQGINEWGQLSVGTCKLFNQLGISQISARCDISSFLNLPGNENFDIQQYFIKRMIDKNKDCYLQVLSDIGISKMVDNESLYIDIDREENGSCKN